jgi:hypothetical protein
LPTAEERERVAVETAATAARLAMAELTVARAEVEAAAADEACAAAAELEALRASSTSNSVSADDDRQRAQAGEADSVGAGVAVDRYHGHHGIHAIVRDVGPDGGWPTLIKTNYVEWAVVMRVRLQVWHMWEAVWYDDVDYYEDRRALDALIAAVPPEM